MSSKVVRACTVVAALSIPADGVAKDAQPPRQGSWPVYNGLNHQPTQDELSALHQPDVTPDQAHEIDRLYNELLGTARAP